MSKHNYTLILLFISFWTCKSSSSNSSFTLFTPLNQNQTGISFLNLITPNQNYNLLDFEYLYNGGGVGSGDFNNDGLPDLIFIGNMVASKIYINEDKLHFKDITESSGINTNGKWCTGVNIIDINNDGFDDIYICVGGAGKKNQFPNLLYINQGDLTFKESAEEYGLDDAAESNHSIFFDYDLDGDLDMYLLNGGGFEKSPITVRPIVADGTSRNTDQLYKCEFDKILQHPFYTNISKKAGVRFEGFGLGVASIDANEDGWPDIYVSNDYLTRDLLYVNNKKGGFEEKAADYFGHTSYFSMGNDAVDINNDGHIDLLTLDMLPEDYTRRKLMFGPEDYNRYQEALRYGHGRQHMRNMLQINNADSTFSEIGMLTGLAKTDWSWCPLIADFDNDGLQDIYITNGYGKDITDLDFVKFRKENLTQFASQEETRKKLLSSLEERPAVKIKNYFFKNNGNLNFSNKSNSWADLKNTISTSAIYVDLDRDGDIDIVNNNINEVATILKNESSEKYHQNKFLHITLKGNDQNKNGIGSSIEVYSKHQKQVRSVQPSRGYLGCNNNITYFGLGDNALIDSIIIKWNSRKISALYNVQSNQIIEIKEKDAVDNKFKKSFVEKFLQQSNKINIAHTETAFNDFNVQPLLIHGFAYQGPTIAVADINADNLDDFFIGGAYNQDGQIVKQSKNKFLINKLESKKYEDLGAIFFNANKDKYPDLYIASGGSERYENHSDYQDRLFINDGKGNFKLDTTMLPKMLTSTSCVAASDIDGDGDFDLAIGGRVVPGKFPISPQSYILENKNGRFYDITETICPELKHIGMVTSMLWTDYNNDGKQDLFICGEFMNLTFFKNSGTKLVNMSTENGLSNTQGNWNSIASADFDKDGDIDYVVGNIGMNIPFVLNETHPLKLQYGDFDFNGSVDPIYSSFDQGQYRPWTSLDIMTSQLPKLKTNHLSYKDFATSTTTDIFKRMPRRNFETLESKFCKSVWLENNGKDKFVIHPLPIQAQYSAINGILINDINMDGYPDMLAIGNNSNTEVVYGEQDASYGSVFLNDKKKGFEFIPSTKSGFKIKGDGRALAELQKANGNEIILAGINNSSIKIFEKRRNSNWKSFRFNEEEVALVIYYADGTKERREYNIGTGYLSQNSKIFNVNKSFKSIKFYTFNGKNTRTITG